ncbi:MAG: class I SAM-dependent methyltransferase [Candidatus Thorarchaeota archaeon]|nr:MAG: class I SAM-dependent methyltransferase [Candidatus Thorarchaeota archaeon]
MDARITGLWDENAQAYADLIGDMGTPHHQQILNPCVESLMGDVDGLYILDAGCGEGYLSRHYAKMGARVLGVDISSKLIEIAQSHVVEKDTVRFEEGDICNLGSISDDTFDCVLCNLVLLNTPCFDAALREIHRVLKPGGFLVFSVTHPAFNFYGPGSWEFGKKDPRTHRRRGLFFKMDFYFQEEPYERFWKSYDGEEFPQPIVFFHRTISTYVNTLLGAGFVISRVEEPTPVKKNDFFERESRIPFFLVIKAEKSKL